jgi:hypothetical protein
MSNPKHSRRDFFRYGTVASAGAAFLLKSPQEIFTESIIKNLLNTARAEAAGLPLSKYYVNINMDGGPLRYSFDHWLRNTGESEVLFSPSLGTAFTYNASNVITGTAYRTFSYKGYEIPTTFLGLDQGSRDAFLDSFLVIRGFGSGVDGHPVNVPLQMHPVSGLPSLPGLIADHSNHPYQAIKFPVTDGFKHYRYLSKNSVGLNMLNGNAPLDALLKPVIATNSLRTLRTANKDVFSNLRALLNSITEGTPQETKAIQIAKNSLSSASELMTRNFAGFQATYSSLVTDYNAVINAALRSSDIPGLTCAFEDTNRKLQILSDGNTTSSLHQIWTSGAGSFVLPTGQDMTKVVDQAYIMNLASGLALAEYCISNNLSSSIEVDSGSLANIRVAEGSGTMKPHLHDMHGTGAYGSTFLMGIYYFALMSGVMRFRDKMIAAGKWQDTMVHFTTEFNRTINANGIGSDHGYNQMVGSVLSGAISGGPYVVGNVYGNVNNLSQGYAAPLSGYPMVGTLGPQIATSTVASILGISNPWKNNSPALAVLNSNGTLNLPFGKGKQL